MRKSDYFFSDCPIPFPTHQWRAWGIRAVDGDTVVLKLDRGFGDEKTDTFRLADFDAYEAFKGPPETRALGVAAGNLSDSLVSNRFLYILTSMDPDKYGRILADVIVEHPPGSYRSLSTVLREAGYEKPKAPAL